MRTFMDGNQPSLQGRYRQSEIAQASWVVAMFPGAEDLLDPAAQIMNVMVLNPQLALGIGTKLTPRACLDHARVSALRAAP